MAPSGIQQRKPTTVDITTGNSGVPLWKMAFDTTNDYIWEKEDVAAVFWWGKQILGIILGVFFGLISFTGFFGVTIYILLQWLLAYAWTERVGASGVAASAEDQFTSGFSGGFAAFVMTWTLIHTIKASKP